MADFVNTGTILDKILAQKVVEVAALRSSAAELRQRSEQRSTPVRDFAGSLQRETVALIAEVKKASPSKGLLIEHFDPVALGSTYAENGAACISVLTDEQFFQGHLEHMTSVRAAVSIPVLRKDFVIDPLQVYEGCAHGADAMLLIVMALDDARLADLHALITGLGMSALVEVHNEAEMVRALKLGATLIGVNNRDLRSFQEDRTTTARLAGMVPAGVTLVAESAIRSAEDVAAVGQAGARAVLVGEGLVKSPDIAAAVRAFSSQARQPHAVLG
ncbi:MAG: indole-3-glycerol phosphate synthase TrpC [Pleurocapsa minor GSE-CHR-MK-17-07R]|jgi:indole-3-glycerol phosphate synthase|nr:indole-3-glycerol phosphate synthase TrpC [Pleurocapsa minor GSE-CHR-MK 17-07R]